MNVIKRNGSIEPFDINKISTAMYKAYREVGDKTKTKKICKEQARQIVDLYIVDPSLGNYLDIERIQDDVENYLMESKHFAAAKAFIKYREKKAEERKNP